MVDSDKPVVTITGVTGFLGSTVALTFLKEGTFRVRGTVRDKNNAAKLAPLRAGLGDLADSMELVEADLLNKQSVIDALAGSTYVVHTASPFIIGVSEENADSLIKPAVDGTLAAMEGAKAAGAKRIVITSSCASVMAMDPKDRPADNKFNETHWSNPDRPGGLQPYTRSKTLAEKAAWDFAAALPEGEKIEVVTINPCLILGPTHTSTDFTSGKTFKKLLTGEWNPIPKMFCPIVDVRDVAMAHLKGVTVAEAANKRFITAPHCQFMKPMADMLHKEFASKGWPISETEG